MFPSDGTDPLVGRVLAERYLVKAVVGRGSMGKVYEATQLDLARPVAVKVLDRDDRRLRDEALAAASLVHPNIIQVTDFHDRREDDDGSEPTFLVMELLRGRSLDSVIRAGPLAPEVVVRIGLQILSALEAAHAARILHRDVKPANVFLLEPGEPLDPRIKLLDFGIAKVLEDDHQQRTMVGQVRGTLPYMAPEQLRGEPVSAATDLYATGVCVFELLTGRRPFDAGRADVAAAILRELPPDVRRFAPNVDESLARVVARALSKRASDRFATASDMAYALRETARGRGVVAGKPAPRWPRRFVIALASTVVVGASAVTAYVMTRSKTANTPPGPSLRPSVSALPREAEVASDAGASFTPTAEVDASVAPATPSKQMCVCVSEQHRAPLCAQLVRSCECWSSDGFLVCKKAFADTCETEFTQQSKSGEACHGFDHSLLQGKRVDAPAEGKLRCLDGCDRVIAMTQRRLAVPQTPCSGVLVESGPLVKGHWVPYRP